MAFPAPNSAGPEQGQREKRDKVDKVNGRHQLGSSISATTDFINENLVLFRYGTMASIVLLTTYGVSKTPLFFRYKKVSSIPSNCFSTRKTIHGRLIAVEPKIQSDSEEAIVCLIKHLSPIGRMFSTSSFDFDLEKYLGSNHGAKHQPGSDNSLLRIEIAGICAPPHYHTLGTEKHGEWLRDLASRQSRVSCTLLHRRQKKQKSFQDELQDHVIGRISFRPGISIFRKDLASSLVSFGRAGVASGMFVDVPSTAISDGSTKLGDIESDAQYLDKLAKVEFEAIKKSKGMWATEEVRRMQSDLVEEAEFEANASIFRKVWRQLTQYFPWKS